MARRVRRDGAVAPGPREIGDDEMRHALNAFPALLLAEIDMGARAGQEGLQDLRSRLAAVVALWLPRSVGQGRLH